jgi:hypothetical protein
LQIFILPTAPYLSSLSFGAGTVGLLLAGVPNGLSLISHQEKATGRIQTENASINLRMKRIQNADKLNFKIFALKYAQARHV